MTYTSPSDDIDGYVPFPKDRIDEYRERDYWKDRTLHDVLDDVANDNPDQVLTIGPDGERTYEEVADRTKRIAAYLRGELGLEPNDRVVFQLTNRREFIELLFGCSRAGVIPVMLLPRHREAEARHIVHLTDAKAFFTIGDLPERRHNFVDLVDGIDGDFETLEHLVAVGGTDSTNGWIDFEELVETDWLDRHQGVLAATQVNPCDPALFLLSGGTTGMPKAIPRTHNDYTFQWEHAAEAIGLDEEWLTMASVPIGHNAAIVVVLGPTIFAGGTFALEPALKPDSLMQTIDEQGVNYTFMVPAQLVDVLEHENIDDYDLSSLRAIMSGGQKVRPSLVYDFVDRYDLEFLNIFGMAEGPLIFTRPGDDVDVQAHTVGRPIHPEADELRIVDRTREEEVPVNDAGELSVRGPGYLTGYFRNPEENEENFDEDGWFYTEDILELDEDGNYRVHGRIKDMIIRGGENIYAPGVEDELIDHPAIENVAVIGMPDERLGERPMAYAELNDEYDELTLDELVEFLDDQGVAVFKRPERLEVVDRLPRTEVEKIKKVELRERVTRELKEEGKLPEDF